MTHDPGLVTWLRGLDGRSPQHHIDMRDATDSRFAQLAAQGRYATLHVLRGSRERASAPHTLVVRLTPFGNRALVGSLDGDAGG